MEETQKLLYLIWNESLPIPLDVTLVILRGNVFTVSGRKKTEYISLMMNVKRCGE